LLYALMRLLSSAMLFSTFAWIFSSIVF